MKFVYIIEDDPRFQKEIVEAIHAVDPKIQIRLFYNLEKFIPWLKAAMMHGVRAIPNMGIKPTWVPQEDVKPDSDDHKLVAIVSKVEFLGARQLTLLKKTKRLFIERSICTAEDPTAFILTAFDDPGFQLRQLEDRILNNVIIKPFDRLILIQHLSFAIDGHHPPSKYVVANQKTKAIVEMLKEVQIESISDIGFVTKSNREIKAGAVSKYYGQIFKSDRNRSLFAVCRSCEPYPAEPGNFRCYFTYFAADQTQISTVRRKTRDKAEKETHLLGDHLLSRISAKNELNILLLDDEEDTAGGLNGLLTKKFNSVNVISYSHYITLLSDLDPAQVIEKRNANLKALGGANEATMYFDLSMSQFLGFEADKTDVQIIFNMAPPAMKAKSDWWSSGLWPGHKEKFTKMIRTQMVDDDDVLAININDDAFFVRVTAVGKSEKKCSIKVIEISKEEQISWIEKSSRLKKPVDLIIASHKYFGEGAESRWKFIKDKLQSRFETEPKILMTAKKEFTDAEERAFGTFVDDIFFKPVDRVYIAQKIKSMFPFLQTTSEPVEIKEVVKNETVKAVNPVDVKEISEAGFVMEYYRQVSVGSFREIVLWQPYEINAPELISTCNFVEESKEKKGSYSCHFIFFGITDIFLKHIRVWIRDNYILSKEGKG
jgi:hypothetical protein